MKLQVVGFAIVMALVVTVVDFSMQARKSGVSIGQLGFSGYKGTITARYDAVIEGRALKTRQKQLAKIHLPDAPEGWTRREWADGDNSRILPPEHVDTAIEAELKAEMGGLMAMDAKMAAQRKQREVWVYESGSEIVAISAQYEKPKPGGGGFSGRAMKVIAGNMEGMSSVEPYAMIQGVAYGEASSLLEMENKREYRVFSAKMGADIRLRVTANASDISIRKLMNTIDYDGLNAMLDQPEGAVGQAAVDVDPAQESAQARAVLEGQSDAVRQAGRDAEQALRNTGEAAANSNGSGLIAALKGGLDADMTEHTPSKEFTPKEIGVGFAPVARMPGQECSRSSGNAICGLLSD